jgi:hypothetical protein
VDLDVLLSALFAYLSVTGSKDHLLVLSRWISEGDTEVILETVMELLIVGVVVELVLLSQCSLVSSSSKCNYSSWSN